MLMTMVPVPELRVAVARSLQHKRGLGWEEGAEEDQSFGAAQAHLRMPGIARLGLDCVYKAHVLCTYPG
jgi:hypothetical protein